jgi:hypothetical protein
VLYLTASVASAQTATVVDPHGLYEMRCARCHGDHAGEFVARGLKRTMSQIAGMLERGHGGLQGAEVEVMTSHLEAIQSAGGLYREKCRICHDRAVDLARRELTLRNGRLVGRYTGRDIESFMGVHGRLSEVERATILDMLTRHFATGGHG